MSSDFPDLGTVLGGRYVLQKILGQGGFGVVYAARDRLLSTNVAVKVLQANRDVLTQRRVWREAAVLRLLDIPGVVQLRDEGIDGGHYFLVMTKVSGTFFPGPGIKTWADLAPRIKSFLSVLSMLHDQGVIHGDLKPGNVLVDDAGQVTLLDFGVAYAQEWEQGTKVKKVRGTPGYIAPELWKGEAPSPASDLFSVGVILYEALSGKRMYKASTIDDVIRRVTLEPIPNLHFELAGIPDAFRWFLESLLAKVPDWRPVSAGAALASLETPKNHVLGTAPPRFEGLEKLEHSGENFQKRELQELFKGTEELFQTRSRAARELWRRTLGQPERVGAEIDAWLRHGIARTNNGDGDRLVMAVGALERLYAGARITSHKNVVNSQLPPSGRQRELLRWLVLAHPIRELAIISEFGEQGEDSLSPDEIAQQIEAFEAQGLVPPADAVDALLPPPPGLFDEWTSDDRQRAHRLVAACLTPGHEQRFFHLILGGEAEEAGREALHAARQFDRNGDTDRAVGMLQEAWMAFGQQASSEGQDELLTTWAKIALASSSPTRIEQALVALERVVKPTETKAKLEQLLRAALLTCQSGASALDSLSALETFEDEELELRCQMYRMQASWACGQRENEEIFKEIQNWSKDSKNRRVQGTVLGWKAKLKYRRGRYNEAAEMNRRAAELKERLTAKLASMHNSASALIEAHRLQEAAEIADHVLELARRFHQPRYQARAQLLHEVVAYRSGEPGVPRKDFMQAVEKLALPELEGLAALSLGASSWRLGNKDDAIVFARQCNQAWSRSGNIWGAKLASALAIHCGDAVDWVEQAAIAEDAEECPLPRVGAQILGLLAPRMEIVSPSARAYVEELAQKISAQQAQARREVLSIAEALEAVRE